MPDAGDFRIASGANSDSTYHLEAGNLNVADDFYVGNVGQGHLFQTGGVVNITKTDSELRLAQNGTTGYGEYRLSGTGQLNAASDVIVGVNGDALFVMSGGVLTMTTSDKNINIG